MNNIDKIILKGRIIVFYGAILLFFFMFMVFYFLKFDNMIAILLSLFISVCYYFISSTNWLLKNILRVENGYELIEQALFYLIITEDNFENLNLLLLTKRAKQKWINIDSVLKNQNKNYFENYKFEDNLIIKSNKDFFNFLSYLFIIISILFCIFGFYQFKYEYVFIGLFFLVIAIFIFKQKKDNKIKIILDKTEMKIDGMPRMNWSNITNERISFSPNGILLSFKHQNKNINLRIGLYDVKPFHILNYIRHYKNTFANNGL